MARMRSIKPEMWASLTVCSWPVPVRWTFAGLLTYLDDAGRGLDEPRLVKADLYPLDDDIPARRVEQHLATIAANGPLCRYQISGRRYLHITTWGEHQRINRPTTSRLPPCPIHESSPESHGGLTEPSVSPHGVNSDGSPPHARAGAPAEHGARSKEQGARSSSSARAGVSVSPPPTDPEHLDLARRAVQAVIPANHPPKIRHQLTEQAAELFAAGSGGDLVTAALVRWAGHPNAGPKLLPSLVSDVIRERGGATKASPRTTLADKAGNWIDIGNQLQEPTLRALPRSWIMNVLQVAAAVLAKASAIDPTMPTPNPLTVQAWAEQLGGVKLQEALDAVYEHYRCTRDRIMPAELIAHVRAARRDADLRANVPEVAAPYDPEVAARHRALVRAVLGAPNEQARTESRALVAPCPWCHAAVGSPCTTAGKRRTTAHPSRIDATRSAA